MAYLLDIATLTDMAGRTRVVMYDLEGRSAEWVQGVMGRIIDSGRTVQVQKARPQLMSGKCACGYMTPAGPIVRPWAKRLMTL